MLSLLGSLLGFGSSFLPKILDYLQDAKDKSHELAMITAQTEAQIKLEGKRLEAVNIDADIRQSEALLTHDAKIQGRASQWVVNLAASVRPIATYGFFLEFAVLTLCVSKGWISLEEYHAIWNEDIQAIWAAVVSFWFGQRTIAKTSRT